MTAYLDVTVALPVMVAYVVQTCAPKPHKRLNDHMDRLHAQLIESYLANNKEVGELTKMMQGLMA